MNDAWIRDTGPVFLTNDKGELRACDSAAFVMEYSEFLSDRYSGIQMVAGDHYRPDACAVALFYGCFHFRTYGIDHSYKSAEDHIGLYRVGVKFSGQRIPFLRGRGKYAQ